MGKGGVFGSSGHAIVCYSVHGLFQTVKRGEYIVEEEIFRDQIMAKGWWCCSFMVRYFTIRQRDRQTVQRRRRRFTPVEWTVLMTIAIAISIFINSY